MEAKIEAVKKLKEIPGVGNSIAGNLWDIGIKEVDDLIGKNPEKLYAMSNKKAGAVQDRCLLYVFRCAVYYASTDAKKLRAEKLKWWNWKDVKPQSKTF